MSSPSQEVTDLLEAVTLGDEDAFTRLFTVVYDKLHQLAHAAMRKERPGITLQTTALVHEAYLRLVKTKDLKWQNRAHFFCVAARAMRRILVDRARSSKTAKRGGGRDPLPLEAIQKIGWGIAPSDDPFEDLEALDGALEKMGLDESQKRKCSVVDLHFFVGLTFDQISEVLNVSVGTIYRDWEFTRAWLRRELERSARGGNGANAEN